MTECEACGRRTHTPMVAGWHCHPEDAVWICPLCYEALTPNYSDPVSLVDERETGG